MSILSALGLGQEVRYAVVGLGDITREAMLPGIAHTGDPELVALVTGDAAKAEGVGKRYGVEGHYGYGEFGELVRSGTVGAVYLATSDWRHAEFAAPALEAGIHLLVETPAKTGTGAVRDPSTAAQLRVCECIEFAPECLLKTFRNFLHFSAKRHSFTNSQPFNASRSWSLSIVDRPGISFSRARR